MDIAAFSSVIAQLSGATAAGPAQRRTDEEESDSLLAMLSNPDFMPPQLRDSNEARNHPPTTYDDLPPLEDEGSTSHLSSRNNPSEDSLPTLEDDDDDEPPPLEDDDSSVESAPPQPAFVSLAGAAATSTSSPSSGPTSSLHPTPAVNPSSVSVQSSARRGVLATPGNSGRATTRPTRGAANDEDDGAESDSSLPSLQSVSDSSDEEDEYVSESEADWDDDESLDESDEANITRIIENERVPSEASHNPATSAASVFANVHPMPAFYPNFDSQMQSLLERARGVLDIDQPLPDFVTDLTMRIAGVDNDPRRAETLLKSMEVVPDELVVRYEKLRSADGEDVDGCAVCRNGLVDKSPDAVEASRVLAAFALLPYRFDMDSVVAFPCGGKHLFHKDCLSPWLARKTTCPTCRFDIDPLSLTLRVSGGLYGVAPVDPEPDPTHPPRVWEPPQVESMRDWLEAEEKVKETGVPRQRPDVVMPEYPPLPLRTRTGIFAGGAAPPRPTRPAGAPLSEILEVPTWGYDPETGNFDMATAYRDMQEMREQFLEARRAQVQNPQPENTEEASTRPPSEPIAPPSGASRSSPSYLPSRPFDPFGFNNAQDRRARQEIAIQHFSEHVIPFHNFSPRIIDQVVRLGRTPVSRDPPPNDVDVDSLDTVNRHLEALRQQVEAGSSGLRSRVSRDLEEWRRTREREPTTVSQPLATPAVPTAAAATDISWVTAVSTTPPTFDMAHPAPGGRGIPTSFSPGTDGDDVPHLSSYNPADDLD